MSRSVEAATVSCAVRSAHSGASRTLAGQMISQVTFHRLKQFRDQVFDLHAGVSLLGGGNNVGKTTILHGLAIWEFCRTAIEMERGPEMLLSTWSGQGIGLGDDEFSPINVPSLKHLWTNLRIGNEGEPDAGYTLTIRCSWKRDGAEERHLEFGLSLANDRLFVKPTKSNLVADDRVPRLAYLPPFAGMTDREARTTGAIRRRRIGEGLAGAVLRNILLDLWERNAAERERLRGDRSKISDSDLAALRASDPWEILQQNLRETFGAELRVLPFREEYHSYIQVQVVKGTIDRFKLKRHSGYNPRDLMVEGSGFLQWLSVFALATDPELDLLLLDEPDAHLHSSLQEELLGSLRRVAPASGKQMLVATHSTEILRNAEPKDILHVRRGHGSGYLTTETQKVGMLAGLGSDYAPRVDRAKRTKRVLFVEGTSDLAVLKIFAEHLGLTWPERWVEWTTAQGQKERKHVYLALKEEIPELVVISLRDRDDEPVETVRPDLVDGSSGDAGFLPRRWRRRYLESYLIWPPAIAAATGLSEDEVNQRLADHHGLAVGASFPDTNPPQALLDVRGKEILTQPATTPIMGQFDASAIDVARHMDPTAIPEDVKTFLDELIVR
jgi:predicted ATPase